MYVATDTIWVLLGAVLVFFMQPGFAMVETGFTRAKNAGNIIMKNFMDFALGSIVFWVIGFGLMFGKDIAGLIGTPDFFVTGDYGASYPSMAYFIFQTVFCATSATIVSGAMAERTRFSVYCVYSCVISALIYPISGHWIWGGGWLMQLGFHDFAGSLAVHTVGGVAALIGAWMLGPRLGKYNEDGSVNAIPGHSLTLGALGVFILWFAWFGFNGGSTVCATGDEALLSMSHIFVTTNMAAAVAATTTMCFTWVRYGKPDISMTLNGALAGLVGVTAGCDLVSVAGSAAIGFICGIDIVLAVELFDQKLKIDDPVGAISVHCVNGILGTILVGIFAQKGGLLYGGGVHMLAIQCLAVAAVVSYVAVSMLILFKLLDLTLGLRVDKHEEIVGLDIEEHNLASSYADFLPVPDGFTFATAAASMAGAVPAFAGVGSGEAAALAGKMMEAGSHGGTISRGFDPDLPTPAAMTAEGRPKLTSVTIITSQDRFEALKTALDQLGITGMTVTSVMGYGLQKGHPEMYRGAVVQSRLMSKVKVEMVISAIPVEELVAVAKKVLYTGKYGDGKIFIHPVEDVVKIRTGETGFDALQDHPLEEEPLV